MAKSGPRTPSTPTSDAAIPRYSSDQLIIGLARMNPIPSRSWSIVEPIARSASAAMLRLGCAS